MIYNVQNTVTYLFSFSSQFLAACLCEVGQGSALLWAVSSRGPYPSQSFSRREHPETLRPVLATQRGKSQGRFKEFWGPGREYFIFLLICIMNFKYYVLCIVNLMNANSLKWRQCLLKLHISAHPHPRVWAEGSGIWNLVTILAYSDDPILFEVVTIFVYTKWK